MRGGWRLRPARRDASCRRPSTTRSPSRFLGRKVREASVGEITERDLPLFVKPLNEKELSGVVANDMADLVEHASRGDGYRAYCSDPVDFASECRLFIRRGSLVGARHFRGDPHVWPDVDVVNNIIKTYAADPDASAGCSIDLGVTPGGKPLLVEVNDGYSLGCYGLDSAVYALLLAARWAELVGVEDALADLDSKGFPREDKPVASDARLYELLCEMPGATEGFAAYAFQSAEWMGAEYGMLAAVAWTDHTRAW